MLFTVPTGLAMQICQFVSWLVNCFYGDVYEEQVVLCGYLFLCGRVCVCVCDMF